MTLTRRMITTAAALGISLAGAGAGAAIPAQAATPQAAHPAASGGGCGSYVSLGGVSVKACVSAQGDVLIFNGWVTGSTSRSCSLRQFLVNADNNITVSSSGTQNCTDGEHNGNNSTLLTVGNYYNQIALTVNGQTVFADSPTILD
jgi:hypothetical protein